MTRRLMIAFLGCLLGVGAVYALGPNTPSASSRLDCRTQLGRMEAHASSWQGMSLRCASVDQPADAGIARAQVASHSIRALSA